MSSENTPSLLWLGAGDIAYRAESLLSDLGLTSCYVSRSARREFDSADTHVADLSDYAKALSFARRRPNYVVASFSPRGRREEDYRQSYLQSLSNIVAALDQVQHAPQLLIFISSTSVYAQSEGERVDESSEAQPTRPTSMVLRECEHLLDLQNYPTCSLRYSGIYGPGRYHLLKQVVDGNMTSNTWTNRIHVDDCARVVTFLVTRALGCESIPAVLLASDDAPVPSTLLRLWLAEQMRVDTEGVAFNEEDKMRLGGKRCNNSLLKALGFEFAYPDYRSGFLDIIDAFLHQQTSSEGGQ